MLIKKCRNCSGYFQIQKGLMQYIDPKINDTFEINVQMIQAIHVNEDDNNKAMSTLDIVGNYQVLKSIKLPTNFAKDSKYWIYLHLHFLGRKDSSKAHKDFQTAEYTQYKRNQRLQVFFFSLVIIIIFTGLYQTVTYSNQVELLKKEAKSCTVEDLITGSKLLIDREEFDEGIHKLLIANVSRPSDDIRAMLDNAYLKRGLYHLSVENVPLAKKDLSYIQGKKTELPPLRAKIKEYESKKWLRFFDIADLVSFSWGTLTHNLDKGQNKERSDELARTWEDFQTKLTYTRINHPFIQGIKDFLNPTVH